MAQQQMVTVFSPLPGKETKGVPDTGLASLHSDEHSDVLPLRIFCGIHRLDFAPARRGSSHRVALCGRCDQYFSFRCEAPPPIGSNLAGEARGCLESDKPRVPGPG